MARRTQRRLTLTVAAVVAAVALAASPAAAADAKVCRAFKVCSAADGAAWTSVQLFGSLDKLVQELGLPGAAADYADVKEVGASTCACAAGSPLLEVSLSLPVPAHLTAPLVAEAVDSFAADDAASAVGHARCLSAPRASLCAGTAAEAAQFRRKLSEQDLAAMPEDVAETYNLEFGHPLMNKFGLLDKFANKFGGADGAADGAYGSDGAEGGYYGGDAGNLSGLIQGKLDEMEAIKAAGLKWAESAGAAAAAAAQAKLDALDALKKGLLDKAGHPLFAAEGSCPACNGDCTLARPAGCAACPGCDRARTIEQEGAQGMKPGAVAGLAIGGIVAGFAGAALLAAGGAKLLAHRKRQAATLATRAPLL
jgi:hypothetical protein